MIEIPGPDDVEHGRIVARTLWAMHWARKSEELDPTGETFAPGQWVVACPSRSEVRTRPTRREAFALLINCPGGCR